MSWLRNHMRHFVIPGIQTIVRDRGRSDGHLTDADIKQSGKRIRPSTKCKYVEAGMLYSLVSSILPRSNVTREIALGLCRQVGQGDDSQFVYELDLGGSGLGDRVKSLGAGYNDVQGSDVLHSFITNSVKTLKKRTNRRFTVIYPGRDVWCWEVLSRKLGMPSLYDPRVSRDVARNEFVLKKVMADWTIPDWKKTILFDSGYAGTVPRAIGRAAGLDESMNVVMLSAVKNKEQIFPTHAKARKKALACEYLAKYRKRTVIRNGEAVQELAGLEQFIKAALLTIWLWHHVSPARLPAWQDAPKKPWGRPKGWVNVKGKGLFIDSNNLTGSITTAGTGIVNLGQGVVWDPNAPAIPTISVPLSFGGTGNIAVVAGTGTTNALTFSSNATTSTGFVSAATTLDNLWGTGASAGLAHSIIQDQNWQIATQQQQIKQLQNIPPKPAIVDPNTFQLLDAKTRKPLPIPGNGPFPGQMPAQGHALGQYPGPPVRFAPLPRARDTITRKHVIDKNGFVTMVDNCRQVAVDAHVAAADKKLDEAKRLNKQTMGLLSAVTGTPPGGGLPDVSIRIDRKKNGDFVKQTLLTTPLITPLVLPSAFKGGPIEPFTNPPGVVIGPNGNVLADNRPLKPNSLKTPPQSGSGAGTSAQPPTIASPTSTVIGNAIQSTNFF